MKYRILHTAVGCYGRGEIVELQPGIDTARLLSAGAIEIVAPAVKLEPLEGRIAPNGEGDTLGYVD